MTAAMKRLTRSVLSPLLRWVSGQIDQLRVRLDALVAGQEELTRLNRQALVERDAGLDVVSRAVGVQAATLESIRAEQANLAEEIRSLREQVAALEPAGDRVVD